jgi:hypothetical protein
MKTHIALFDMDGVLLESRGYHIALQETVQWLAMDLGLPDLRLSAADIAAFEAGGVTCEWDEAAICHAVMLRLRAGLDAPASFAAAAARLAEPDLLPLHPLQRAEKLLVELPPQPPSSLAQGLRQVLRQARDIHTSPSQRLFQELVLGSAAYARAYGLPPQRQSNSYLSMHDQPLLTESSRGALDAWLAQPGCSGAIFTSRPNQPPPGVFGTPEAEIGAALVGLESLPISGRGGLCWLAEHRQLDPQELIKPHAVHALSALQLALGAPYSQALASAMCLGWDGQLGSAWATLDGAEVSVFEDTRGGLLSLAVAQQILARHGIQFQAHLYGIAVRPVKVAALQAAGAAVYSDLSAALCAAGI